MEATLQAVFDQGFNHYRQHHGISIDQQHAANAIMSCGTDVLGHETWGCLADGYEVHQAHSCRHRSCPRCHARSSHAWLDKTQSRLLTCDHYHVVFTLPHELNELWQYNRQWSADHLFKASAETLRQLLKDDRYLGADVGLLSSLHTWGRTLSFHPHVHVLVTGGGLNGSTWRELKKDFLLPVGVLKSKFRGKWLSWLNEAYAAGALKLPDHWTPSDWKRLLAKIARKNWNVHIEGPYRHGRGVTNYLSRYVYGGPIKDQRLMDVQPDKTCFRYRDHHDGKDKTMQLKADDFIHRVLSHVPVKGQHNIRYYGLYVPSARAKRDQIRQQLGDRPGESYQPEAKPERVCPQCGGVLLHRSSTRRTISYIKNNTAGSKQAFVQQDVEIVADRGWRIFFAP